MIDRDLILAPSSSGQNRQVRLQQQASQLSDLRRLTFEIDR
jgi:hypothetical protein